jgi:hypothetical protein
MKKILIFTVLLVGVLTLGFSQAGNSWTVNNTASWIEAVNGIRSGGNNKTYTITVTGNVSVPASPESTFGSVTGITVTIEGSGTLSPSANGVLLFVGTGQTVVAKNVTLRGRTDNGSFSVVGISSEGIFSMEGSAKVTGNTISGNGGGVYVDEQGTFTMQDTASVSGNTVRSGFNNGGGGGVYVSDGTFIMQGNATVSGNTAFCSNMSYYGGGGGVRIYSGTFTMQDSAMVSNNSAVSVRPPGSYNSAPVHGGGIYNSGIFTMKGGTISNNTGNSSGGGSGIYNDKTFIMEEGFISDNTGRSGVGNRGTFIMRGGTISNNTSTSWGGGVNNSGTFTIEDGTISGNTAIDNNSDCYGGGVFNNGEFTMKGGTISENTVSATGRKYKGDGGGVYNRETFTMQGSASISGNTASGSGGGVYHEGSSYYDHTFTMQDNASISGNTASNGGGVCLSGDPTFTKNGVNVYGNDSDQNLRNTATSGKGHALYEIKNGSWRNATAGPTMNLDSYGFWLGEDARTTFPSSFIGIWKRSNFNNTLTFTENTIKISSNTYTYEIMDISGDSYTMKRNNANPFTLIFKLTSGNIVISGDSGSGQDNWNGTWSKQR